MTTENTNRQPTHRLYSVKGEGKNSRWIEIGAAWANRDGEGYSIKLDVVPMDGHIVMRAPKAKDGGQQ